MGVYLRDRCRRRSDELDAAPLELDAVIDEWAGQIAETRPSQAGSQARGRHQFSLTDLGNAQRFVAAYGANIRYCQVWKSQDDVGRPTGLPGCTGVLHGSHGLQADRCEGAGEEDEEQRKASRWRRHGRGATRIANIVKLAATFAEVAVTPDVFDCDHYLFNAANCTIDLRTGKPREHRREDLITKITTVAYADKAECPTFLPLLAVPLARASDVRAARDHYRLCSPLDH